MTRENGQIALVISPYPSHPTIAGNRQRTVKLCEKLRTEGYKIHYLWFALDYGGFIEPQHMKAMQNYWDLVHVVNVDSRKNYSLIDQESLSGERFWDDSIRFAIDWLCLQYDYKICLVNYVFYTKAFARFVDTECMCIVDTHDVFSNRDPNTRPRPQLCISADEEKIGLEKADLVLAIQDAEGQSFKARLSNPVQVVSHIVDAHPVSRLKPKDWVNIGIIGSEFPPNIIAAQAFLDAVASQSNEKRNDLNFHIAGKLSSALRIPETLKEKVIVHGVVRDLASFYGNIDVLVNPVEEGTGQKIKTIEALSFSIPIIGTNHAFSGFSTLGGDSLKDLTAVSARECCSLLMRCKADPDLRKRIEIACLQAFIAYQAAIEEQWTSLLAALDRIAIDKESFALGSIEDSLKEYDDIVVYGAGSGLDMFLATIDTKTKAKIRVVLDRIKTGLIDDSIPIQSPENILLNENERHQSLVIITVLSAEWIDIRSKLRALGFQKIMPIHKYLRDRVSF